MMRFRRTRWVALGAVVATSIAGGGVMLLQATGSASSFVPITPTRIVDTRIDLGLVGPLVHDSPRLLQVTGHPAVPLEATAVVMNVTVAGPSAAGYLSVRPGSASGVPSTSNLNFSAGTAVPNSVTVELPSAGNVNLYYFGSPGATTELLIDVVGYYVDGGSGPPGADGASGVSGANYGRQVIYTTSPDSANDVGFFPSATIGADGLPIIAHYDSTNGDLRVTHCNDTACATAGTTAVDTTNLVGWDPAITIGADGLPIIAHHDVSGNLRITHCSNLACSAATSIVADTGGGGDDPAITIGIDGLPIVAHTKSPGDLRVTHCDDVMCTTSTSTSVDTDGDVGGKPSITVGTDGLPIIAHYDSTSQNLRVTHCSNTSCSAATHTSLSTAGVTDGRAPSIAIGIDGLAIVAYMNVTFGGLSVAHCEDFTCSSATHADVGGDGGDQPSMVIGVDGLPIIAHRYDHFSELRLTRCSDILCSASTSSVVRGDAFELSIVIGRDGHVIVASRASTGTELRVTKIVHMSWTEHGWES